MAHSAPDTCTHGAVAAWGREVAPSGPPAFETATRHPFIGPSRRTHRPDLTALLDQLRCSDSPSLASPTGARWGFLARGDDVEAETDLLPTDHEADESWAVDLDCVRALTFGVCDVAFELSSSPPCRTNGMIWRRWRPGLARRGQHRTPESVTHFSPHVVWMADCGPQCGLWE